MLQVGQVIYFPHSSTVSPPTPSPSPSSTSTPAHATNELAPVVVATNVLSPTQPKVSTLSHSPSSTSSSSSSSRLYPTSKEPHVTPSRTGGELTSSSASTMTPIETSEVVIPVEPECNPRQTGLTPLSSSPLSTFDYASIGIGVLVLFLIILLGVIVSALVCRHRKLVRQHREKQM